MTIVSGVCKALVFQRKVLTSPVKTLQELNTEPIRKMFPFATSVDNFVLSGPKVWIQVVDILTLQNC